MTAVKDNSSLPLLLSITGAVVAVAVGGWYLLNADAIEAMPAAANQEMTLERPALVVEQAADEDSARADSALVDVESELRKARLAAEADNLVFPATQSALYYYGRVLQTDAGHAIANAELDAVLANLARTVASHLAAEEFSNAYEIATLVARRRPEHALVLETQQTLDGRTGELVAEAIQHAQDGKDRQATEALAKAEALPGRNRDYFDAVRTSIADIQTVRLAAEKDKAERAKLAANEARAAWVASVRKAINDGNLVAPAGASALDLLGERNSWRAERTQLTGELVAALIAAAEELIDSEQPLEAEPLVRAAGELGDNTDELQDLEASLENAFLAKESNRIASISELVRVNAVPPRYPRRAQERNVSGWVDVYFTVTATGKTADVSVNRSEPGSIFDRAAIEAVERWAFQPVEYRGQVISQRAGTRVIFRLE